MPCSLRCGLRFFQLRREDGESPTSSEVWLRSGDSFWSVKDRKASGYAYSQVKEPHTFSDEDLLRWCEGLFRTGYLGTLALRLKETAHKDNRCSSLSLLFQLLEENTGTLPVGTLEEAVRQLSPSANEFLLLRFAQAFRFLECPSRARELYREAHSREDRSAFTFFEFARFERDRGNSGRAQELVSEGLRFFGGDHKLNELADLLEGDLAVLQEHRLPHFSEELARCEGGAVYHFVETALPLRNSGYTRRLTEIQQALAVAGIKNSALAAPSPSPPHSGEQVHFLTSPAPVPYSRIPLNRYLKSYVEQAAVLLNSESVRLLHAHTNFKNGAAALAFQESFPVVYEIRNLWEESQTALGATDPDSIQYHQSREMEQLIANEADAVVTLSHALRKDLIERGVAPEKIFLVPNGVDLNAFQPMEKSESVLNRFSLHGCFVLGYTGGISRYEGLVELASEMPEIIESAPNVRLLIVGGGKDEERLRKVVQELSLEKVVQVVSQVPQGEVQQYLSVIDCFVLPRLRSRVTELVPPIKPLEAMAAKKVLLMSDLPVLRELSPEGKRALFFDPDESGSLKQAVLRLVQEGSGGVEEAAFEFVQKERSWGTVASQYEEAYHYAEECWRKKKGRAS